MPYARVNGADLYYEEQGSGPPVIFHHGYTSSHDCWEDVYPRLADRYRCIAMDGRGAGDSASAPGPFTLAQYADDVCGMADALGIDRFRYVGLSMGGATGYELGLRHADRLESMVLVAPAPADGIQNPEAGHAHSQDQRRRQAREEMLRERMLTGGRPNEDYLRRAVERALNCSDGHFEDAWTSMVDLRVGSRLGGIQTPVLMVAGAADGLLQSNLADFARLGNATLHVFSRVGHGIPYEVPSALSRVVADFFEHGVVTAQTLRERMLATRA